MISLTQGAERVMTVCAATQPGEVVTILVDQGMTEGAVGRALAAAASAAGADVVVLGAALDQPLADDVVERVVASDLVVAPTSLSFAHTPFAQAVARRGTRILAMTQADADTLTSAVMMTDFAAIAPWCTRVADLMTDADRVRVTTAAGTDLQGTLTGRRGIAGVAMSQGPGSIMGCPNIEAYVAPVEGSVYGRLVIDASTTYFGLLDEPLVVEVDRGQAVSISGGRDAGRLERLLREHDSPSCYIFGEVGIGMNPNARLVGKIIEDESVYGTGHFALGTNTLFGGANPAPVHADLVYHRPTVTFDDDTVLLDGELTWPDRPEAFRARTTQ